MSKSVVTSRRSFIKGAVAGAVSAGVAPVMVQSYLPSCSFLILPAFETYSFSYFYFFHFALQYKQIILLPDTIIKPSLSNSMKPQKISDFFCSLLYRRRIQK